MVTQAFAPLFRVPSAPLFKVLSPNNEDCGNEEDDSDNEEVEGGKEEKATQGIAGAAGLFVRIIWSARIIL